MSLNRFQFVGNLTRDPELRQSDSGKAVVSLQLANNRVWYTGDGEKRGEAHFFRIKAFDQPAENHAKFLGKGSKIYVEGRIENTAYEQDGATVYGVDFIADRVDYLDRKKD